MSLTYRRRLTAVAAALLLPFVPLGTMVLLAAPATSAPVTPLIACTFPAWAEGNTYPAGTRVSYAGRGYEALVSHTAHPGANWNPVAAATLWRDLGACDGGGTPSPSPTTPAPTTPAPTTPPPTTPPPGGTLPVAPYVDMGAWPTPSLATLAGSGGVRAFSLGFVTASGCKAMWFNAYDPRAGWMLEEINALRQAGGDVKVSFGGATGIELAQACTDVASLAREYDAVVKAYGLRYIDLDIEGSATAEPASIQRRAQALAQVQRANPGLRISFTLPVLPSGLTESGVNVVRTARDAGVAVDLVNVMAMDYYQGPGDQGKKAIEAATSTFNQIKALYPDRADAQLWRMVGVTPMIGVNDSQNEIFYQEDARELVAFAGQRHLGMVSFWETTRDRNACTGALYRCTNVPQQPYEFARIFAGYRG